MPTNKVCALQKCCKSFEGSVMKLPPVVCTGADIKYLFALVTRFYVEEGDGEHTLTKLR